MKAISRSITILGLALSASLSFAQETVQQTTTTTSSGTISDLSPQALVIKSETASEPMHYTYTKSTAYVDENGVPVSMETVKSGLPVTVYYVKDGDNMVASKVIVRKSVATIPDDSATIQKKQTTTTTTTTGKD